MGPGQVVHVTIEEWPEDKPAAPKGDARKGSVWNWLLREVLKMSRS